MGFRFFALSYPLPLFLTAARNIEEHRKSLTKKQGGKELSHTPKTKTNTKQDNSKSGKIKTTLVYGSFYFPLSSMIACYCNHLFFYHCILQFQNERLALQTQTKQHNNKSTTKKNKKTTTQQTQHNKHNAATNNNKHKSSK